MRDRGADRAARTHLALIAEMRQEESTAIAWEMASVEIVFLRLGCDAISVVVDFRGLSRIMFAFVEIHFCELWVCLSGKFTCVNLPVGCLMIASLFLVLPLPDWQVLRGA